MKQSTKTVESQYSRLTPVEHGICLRGSDTSAKAHSKVVGLATQEHVVCSEIDCENEPTPSSGCCCIAQFPGSEAVTQVRQVTENQRKSWHKVRHKGKTYLFRGSHPVGPP